jgi:origin recognition complex subunit 4
MSSSALGRKRSRSRLLDQDELSPEKGRKTAPLASIKKRKLNANGSSAADGITSSVKRAVGGVFSWGKEKENLTEETDEEEDELASGESLDSGKGRAPEKDIYDIESSPEGVRKRRSGSERTVSTHTPNKAKSASEKGSAKTKQVSEADDIWEVPDDELSAKRPTKRFTSKAEKAKALLAPLVQDEDTPTMRSPGRPKKSQILKEDLKLSKKAARERMMAATSGEGNDADQKAKNSRNKQTSGPAREDSPAEEMDIVISAKRLKPERSRKGDIPKPTEPLSAASTGKKGRPRRTSIDVTDSSRHVPKGILTPSKNKPGRPRKSVTFGEGEVDLGFKDILGKKSKKSFVELKDVVAGATEEEVVEETDEEEDVACAICSGLRSTKKNPIILCDGEDCEYAAHKNCEKLSVIPEEDWFCKDCQSSLEPEIEDAPAENVESDESEEEACAICSGLDSKAKNPIILCDGEDCDYAVHIKCCQLSAVPPGKWFCEECKSKDLDNSLLLELNGDLSLADSPNDLPDIEGFEEHLRCMQRTLLDKLTGQKRIRLRGHDEEMKKVHQVVEQTVLAGEGNSMLVIGARGSGKTTVSYLEIIF